MLIYFSFAFDIENSYTSFGVFYIYSREIDCVGDEIPFLSFSFFGFFLTFSLFLKFFMFVICLKIVSLHEWSTQSHVNPSIGLTNIRISDFSLCNKTPVIQDRSFCYLQSFYTNYSRSICRMLFQCIGKI